MPSPSVQRLHVAHDAQFSRHACLEARALCQEGHELLVRALVAPQRLTNVGDVAVLSVRCREVKQAHPPMAVVHEEERVHAEAFDAVGVRAHYEGPWA